MGVLVSSLVTKTRAAFNDEYSDHFAQDDVSDQVDGSNKRFKSLNQNIVNIADGAPADPALFVNGTAVAGSMNLSTGIFTATTAPTSGALASLEYYFTLIDDNTYIQFAQMAASFIGVAQVIPFTTLAENSFIDPNIETGAVRYMHAQAAKKMANLSSWYYSANAGNKSFNKDAISNKFLADAKDENDQAEKERDGFYTRKGARNAPAQRITTMPFPSYTPPR